MFFQNLSCANTTHNVLFLVVLRDFRFHIFVHNSIDANRESVFNFCRATVTLNYIHFSSFYGFHVARADDVVSVQL
jgi:hypothetical protein